MRCEWCAGIFAGLAGSRWQTCSTSQRGRSRSGFRCEKYKIREVQFKKYSLNINAIIFALQNRRMKYKKEMKLKGVEVKYRRFVLHGVSADIKYNTRILTHLRIQCYIRKNPLQNDIVIFCWKKVMSLSRIIYGHSTQTFSRWTLCHHPLRPGTALPRYRWTWINQLAKLRGSFRSENFGQLNVTIFTCWSAGHLWKPQSWMWARWQSLARSCRWAFQHILLLHLDCLGEQSRELNFVGGRTGEVGRSWAAPSHAPHSCHQVPFPPSANHIHRFAWFKLLNILKLFLLNFNFVAQTLVYSVTILNISCWSNFW